MRLLGVGPDANGFAIGLGGGVGTAALLLRHAEVKPALEVIRRELHQFFAIARRGLVIVRVERAGGQTFERSLRMRAHGQQPLGIVLDGGRLFAGHADGDQVHQAFFRLRVLAQNLDVQAGGFVELPQQLQGDGLAEERGLVLGVRGENLVEAGDGRLRLLLPQQANAPAQIGLLALRVHLQGLLERIRGFLPAAELLVTDPQVEVRRGMLRSRAQQLLVGLHGVVILLQLELDVAFGGVDIRALLAVFDGRVELAQSFLALALQVQGHGSRQRRRYRLCVSGSRCRVCLFLYTHGCQLPFVVS